MERPIPESEDWRARENERGYSMDAFMSYFINICTGVSWWWRGTELMSRNTPSISPDVADRQDRHPVRQKRVSRA